MPRLSSLLPAYRRHRASGQAIVTLYGKDFYLGPHGTKASKIEYDRLIGEWVAAGRPSLPPKQYSDITVVELSAAYRRWAKKYYRKNGKPTDTIYEIVRATDILCEKYGRTDARDFGPLAFKAYQQDLIKLGYCRRSVNHLAAAVKRMFRWAVADELVTPSVLQAINAVPGIKKGRSDARESPPVRPVPDAVVDATLPALPAILADMVRFERYTGCRPAEVCIVRPCDVDSSGEVWQYIPESHKTEHHGRERVIFIGPKGQDVLRPYLLRPKDSYCFVPQESERKRNAERRENRQSPMTPSQAKRRPKRYRRRAPGAHYETDAYRRAITRAVRIVNQRRTLEAAEKGEKPQILAHWHPNQLRHSAATAIRKHYGLEAAQVTLGHASADVSQLYAERDLGLAAKIMGEVG